MKAMNRDELDCSVGGAGVAVAGCLATAGHAVAGSTVLQLASIAKGATFCKMLAGSAVLGPVGIGVGLGVAAIGIASWLFRD